MTATKTVSRTTFVRRLRKIGDIDVPKGHARRNKGVVTYFFDHSKIEEVFDFLSDYVMGYDGDPIAGRFELMHHYTPLTFYVTSEKLEVLTGDSSSHHSSAAKVLLHITNSYVSVAILAYPG